MSVDFPFFDSVAHFNAAQVTRKWTWGTISISATGNPRGGPYYNGSSGGINRTCLNEFQTVVIGLRLRYPTAFQGSTPIVSGSNQGQAVSIAPDIIILNDGRIQIRSSVNLGNTTWIVPGFVAQIGNWYYLEFLMQLGTTSVSPTGHPTFSWEVRINNNSLATGTAASTNTNAGLSFPNTGPNFATINDVGAGGIDVCDIYMTDGEFLDDGACQAYFTRLDGTYTAGVPSTPGAHYLMMREHIADDAVTTVALAVVGDKDSSLMDLVGGYQTIKGVQYLWCAYKPLAGVSSFKGFLKSGGSEIQTQEFFPSDAAFFYHRLGYRKSPHTTVDYTQVELNAQEVGKERIS